MLIPIRTTKEVETIQIETSKLENYVDKDYNEVGKQLRFTSQKNKNKTQQNV